MLLMLRARAVSNHEGGPCVSTSSLETHEDEVDTGHAAACVPSRNRPSLWLKQPTILLPFGRLIEHHHLREVSPDLAAADETARMRNFDEILYDIAAVVRLMKTLWK